MAFITFPSLGGEEGVITKLRGEFVKVGQAAKSGLGTVANALSGFAGALASGGKKALAGLGEMAAGLLSVEVEGEAMNAVLGASVLGGLVLLGVAAYELVKHLGALRAVMILAGGAFIALSVAVAAGFVTIDVASGGIVPLIGLIATALVALVAGIIYLATHWSQSWAEIKRIFDDAVKFLRSGFGTFVVLLTGPIAPLLLLALHWQQVWSGIKTAASDVWNFLDSVVFSGIVSGINDLDGAVSSAIGSVIGSFKAFYQDLINWFSDAGTWLLNAGKDIVEGLIHGIENAAGAALSAIKGFGGKVIGAFRTALSWFSEPAWSVQAGTDISTGLGSGITKGSASAVNAAKSVSQGIINAFGSLSNIKTDQKAVANLAGIFTSLAKVFTNLGTASDAGANVGGNLKIITSALKALGAAAPGIATAIGNVHTQFAKFTAGQDLKSISKDMSNLSGVFTSFYAAAIAGNKVTGSAIGAVTNALNNLANAAKPISGDISKVVGAFSSLTGGTVSTSGSVVPQLKALSGVFSAVGGVFTSFATTAYAANKVVGSATSAIENALINLIKAAHPIRTGISLLVYAFSGMTTEFGLTASAIPGQLSAVSRVFKSLGGLFTTFAGTVKAAGGITQTGVNNLIGALWILTADAPAITGAIGKMMSEKGGFGSLKNIKNDTKDIGAVATLFTNLGTAFTNLGNASSAASGVSANITTIGASISRSPPACPPPCLRSSPSAARPSRPSSC